jgi:hypothetical protein
VKFISDGTWFDKGTEVTILAECGTVYDKDGKPSLQVLASGLRNGDLDEEMCDMEEFIIVGDDFIPQ